MNVSSLSAFLGASEADQPIVAYNASKGALEALTRDLALKLARDGIRVNALATGPFDTDMVNHIRNDPAALARTTRKCRSAAQAAPTIKGAAVFLASDAGAFVTGAGPRVDGGVSAVYSVRKFGLP